MSAANIDWHEPPPRGYLRNDKGDLVHERNIKDTDREMDAVVEKIHGFGRDLSAQMARFRDYTLGDILEFVDRITHEYGGSIGGRKGNVTLTSFCGTKRVQLAQATMIEVGPEINAARNIIEECIEDWSRHSSVKLRALVDQALTPNAQGEISVSALLRLRRVEIPDDPRWGQVCAAIADALRPRGKAEYIRLYRRETPDDGWEQVPLNLAHVRSASRDGETRRAALHRRAVSVVEDARRAGLGEREIQHLLSGARRKPPEPLPEPGAEAERGPDDPPSREQENGGE